MKTFKGLTLEPETAFRQIAVLIKAGLIISVTNTNDKSDLSDCVFYSGQTIRRSSSRLRDGERKVKTPLNMPE